MKRKGIDVTDEEQRAEWDREDRDHEIYKLWANELVNDNLERGSPEWFLAWDYFKAGYLAATNQED